MIKNPSIRLCLMLMFETENKPVHFESLYGEHHHSVSDVESNDTILQREIFNNYTRNLAQAK